MPPTPYINIFKEASMKYNVPLPVLLAFGRAESGLAHRRPNGQIVRSPAGAIGIMQLMPGTAAGMGLDPNDLRQNIMGGAQYLANALKRHGNWRKAAEAYNAGPNAVTPIGQAPKYQETRDYVARIERYLMEAGYDGDGRTGGVAPGTSRGAAQSHGAGYTGTPAAVAGPSPDLLADYERKRNRRSRIQGLISESSRMLDLPTFHLPAIEPPKLTDVLNQPAGAAASVASQSARAGVPTSVKGSPVGANGASNWFTPGGGWHGTEQIARNLATMATQLGLKATSEKRDRVHTKSGGVSDHYIGNERAYAFDLSNGSNPTPEMDAAAARIAAALGVKDWKGGVLNVNKGGYRIQLLYRTNVGGNHFNHVHLGVRKL